MGINCGGNPVITSDELADEDTPGKKDSTETADAGSTSDSAKDPLGWLDTALGGAFLTLGGTLGSSTRTVTDSIGLDDAGRYIVDKIKNSGLAELDSSISDAVGRGMRGLGNMIGDAAGAVKGFGG